MEDTTYLGKRRDRAIAIILSYKEQNIDPYLPDDVATTFRKVVLDQINGVVNLAFDLFSAESVYNEEFMSKLDDVETDEVN